MKIIDEKGRLFGRVNIIDFLVILVIACILPAFYLGYKIMSKKSTLPAKKEFTAIEIETDGKFIKLEPGMIADIAAGDKDLEHNGEVIGEIVSLGKSEPYKYKIDMGTGQEIVKADETLKELRARFKLKVEVRGDKLYYNDQLIQVDLPFKFRTAKYSLAVVPVKEDGEEPIEEEFNLFVVLKDLSDDTVKKISVGDKEVDQSGQVIAEILSLGKVENNTFKVSLGKGKFDTVENSDTKQVSTRMRLKCTVVSNPDKEKEIYFKGKKIEHNIPFEFKTEKYTAMGQFVSASPVKEGAVIDEQDFDLFIVLKNLSDDTVKKISVGDKEVGQGGQVIAEILSLGKVENNTFEVSLGKGSFDTVENSGTKQVSTRMRLKCTVVSNPDKEKELYFKGKKIELNIPFEFKTEKYTAMGQFKSSATIREKWLSLQVKFSEVRPEVANIIKKGDVERDAYDNTVARINAILKNDPSQMMTLTLRDRKFITIGHPYYKDIDLALEVKCVEKERGFYFNNHPIKMGNSITFSTDLYSITGLIVGMEIK